MERWIFRAQICCLLAALGNLGVLVRMKHCFELMMKEWYPSYLLWNTNSEMWVWNTGTLLTVLIKCWHSVHGSTGLMSFSTQQGLASTQKLYSKSIKLRARAASWSSRDSHAPGNSWKENAELLRWADGPWFLKLERKEEPRHLLFQSYFKQLRWWPRED